MRKLSLIWVVPVVSAMSLMAPPGDLFAAELGWSNLAIALKGTPVDVHLPQSCDQCAKEGCVSRIPVKKCVTGKKKVYDCKVRCEYVTIPEIRYRFVNKMVCEEIPCCYCKPVCKSKDVSRCYESEKWKKYGFGSCKDCGGMHCKYCENKVEKVSCKHCGREPGQTTIKVRYRSCVKEPYTVYRQVRRQVCVKQPRYEKVQVPITKYVCRGCDDKACHDPGCGECGDPSCGYAEVGGVESALPSEAPLPPETSGR